MHRVLPKRSVILLRVSVLLLIAVLLLSWAVLLYFSPFMLQSHVPSDIPHASRHLLVCTQHSICAWCSQTLCDASMVLPVLLITALLLYLALTIT